MVIKFKAFKVISEASRKNEKKEKIYDLETRLNSLRGVTKDLRSTPADYYANAQNDRIINKEIKELEQRIRILKLEKKFYIKEVSSGRWGRSEKSRSERFKTKKEAEEFAAGLPKKEDVSFKIEKLG